MCLYTVASQSYKSEYMLNFVEFAISYDFVIHQWDNAINILVYNFYRAMHVESQGIL